MEELAKKIIEILKSEMSQCQSEEELCNVANKLQPIIQMIMESSIECFEDEAKRFPPPQAGSSETH